MLCFDSFRVFDVAAEIGCGRGHIIQNITSDSIKFLYQCDHSLATLVSDKVFLQYRDFPTNLLIHFNRSKLSLLLMLKHNF